MRTFVLEPPAVRKQFGTEKHRIWGRKARDLGPKNAMYVVEEVGAERFGATLCAARFDGGDIQVGYVSSHKRRRDALVDIYGYNK
jgi:hypothetical protein